MDSLVEDNLILLLADSNLPLGGFHFRSVPPSLPPAKTRLARLRRHPSHLTCPPGQHAERLHLHLLHSAGLESSTKHGFLPANTSPAGPSPVIPFMDASLRQHARSTLSFVARAYGLAADPTSSSLAQIGELDALYEAMTSNHVTRRGSKIQGVGMLTIWQKALKRPAWLAGEESALERERGALMDALRLEVRLGKVVGHMPVAWGVLCACLGISLGVSVSAQHLPESLQTVLTCPTSLPALGCPERTLHLHLYLHARSLLSSSVRLNQTGPYHAQLLLLHSAPPLIAAELRRFLAPCADPEGETPSSSEASSDAIPAAPLSTFLPDGGFAAVGDDRGIAQTLEEQDARDRAEGEAQERGPATTWPVGEMLQARHDVMHSRMFNT
jgi:urease accessory protein